MLNKRVTSMLLVAMLLIQMVVMALPLPAMAAVGSLTYKSGPVYDATYSGWKWTYEANTGSAPAISHIEFSLCVPCEEIIAKGGATQMECAGSGSGSILKFGDYPFGEDNSIIEVWFVLSKYRTAGSVGYLLKGGTGILGTGSVTGPICEDPESVSLANFSVTPGQGGVQLSWETGSEYNTLGFNILRGRTAVRSEARRVNSALIPSESFGIMGTEYAYLDASASDSLLYYYWLEDIDLAGQVGHHYLGQGRWSAPRINRVNPELGEGPALLNTRFVTVIRDLDQDLKTIYFVINRSASLDGGVTVRYDVESNLFWQYDDRNGGIWNGGWEPRQAVTGTSRWGSFRPQASRVAYWDNIGAIQITWTIHLWNRFAGDYNMYVMAEDVQGNTNGWQQVGTWTVLPAN